MEQDDTTVASLQSHIRDLEQEIADTKRMVNRLLARKGQPPAYGEAAISEMGNVFAIRSDQFYGLALSTAIREYLKMRQSANLGAATANEIYDALSRGGFAYDTENVENRKRNLRISLTKNSALFHRLKNGTHFGLPDWYETVPKTEDADGRKGKAKKTKGGQRSAGHRKTRAKNESAREDVPRVEKSNAPRLLEHKAAGNSDGKITVSKALREAVLAMPGDFTKQQVVDWIDQHHPDLKAQQRKTSIFSMMASLKGDLKLLTTQKGKGTEPHRFRREAALSIGGTEEN